MVRDFFHLVQTRLTLFCIVIIIITSSSSIYCEGCSYIVVVLRCIFTFIRRGIVEAQKDRTSERAIYLRSPSLSQYDFRQAFIQENRFSGDGPSDAQLVGLMSNIYI